MQMVYIKTRFGYGIIERLYRWFNKTNKNNQMNTLFD